MFPIFLYLAIFICVAYLADKKHIDRNVFFLIVGIFLLASAGEELIATGYIRDAGSPELISDYASYTKAVWFRFGLGVVLTIVTLISINSSHLKKSKQR